MSDFSFHSQPDSNFEKQAPSYNYLWETTDTVVVEGAPADVHSVRVETGLAGNALNLEVLAEISSYFHRFARMVEQNGEDDSAVAFVISSDGFDSSQFGRDGEGNLDDQLAFQWCASFLAEAVDAISGMHDRTIAVIDGNTKGAALQLALSAGKVYVMQADEAEATLAFPEVSRDSIPAVDGIFNLLSRVTNRYFQEGCRLLWTGETFSPSDAMALGVIDAILSSDAYLEAPILASRHLFASNSSRPSHIIADSSPDLGKPTCEAQKALQSVFPQLLGKSRGGARSAVATEFRILLKTGQWKEHIGESA